MVLKINLALQGGGAHGAFTWGVLDRLLEDPEIEFAGISGCSAGALNAAALKAGLLAGGREAAKANLDWLWAQVGAVHDFRLNGWIAPFVPFAAAVGDALDAVVPFSPQGVAAQVVSPYSYGPFWANPLERVVRRLHYDRVCASEGPELFISATNVRSGKVKVFEGEEITTDAILASACLPTVFRAVEIEDKTTGRVEAYWDGGFSGNPALFPLYKPSLPDDIVIVSINPLWREELPTTALDIQNRINEVSFNASLLAQLRAVRFVVELIDQGKVPRGAMKDVKVHLISDDAIMNDLSPATKLTPTPYLLFRLKEAGRAAASKFLREHKAKIGRESSVNLRELIS